MKTWMMSLGLLAAALCFTGTANAQDDNTKKCCKQKTECCAKEKGCKDKNECCKQQKWAECKEQGGCKKMKHEGCKKKQGNCEKKHEGCEKKKKKK